MDTNELIKYVKLLEGLMHSGFKCEKELGESLKVLHSEMTRKMNSDKIFVAVIENDFESARKSFDVFKTLLSCGSIYSSSERNYYELKSLNKTVVVLTKDSNVSRGLRPDYVVNNTDDPELPSKLFMYKN